MGQGLGAVEPSTRSSATAYVPAAARPAAPQGSHGSPTGAGQPLTPTCASSELTALVLAPAWSEHSLRQAMVMKSSRAEVTLSQRVSG